MTIGISVAAGVGVGTVGMMTIIVVTTMKSLWMLMVMALLQLSSTVATATNASTAAAAAAHGRNLATKLIQHGHFVACSFVVSSRIPLLRTTSSFDQSVCLRNQRERMSPQTTETTAIGMRCCDRMRGELLYGNPEWGDRRRERNGRAFTG